MCFLVISTESSPKSEFSLTEGLVQISLVSPTMSLIESAGSHTALLRPVPMSFHLELSTALWLPWHRPRGRAGGPAGGPCLGLSRASSWSHSGTHVSFVLWVSGPHPDVSLDPL